MLQPSKVHANGSWTVFVFKATLAAELHLPSLWCTSTQITRALLALMYIVNTLTHTHTHTHAPLPTYTHTHNFHRAAR